MGDYSDIIALLPLEISSHIFSVLDARSIVACSRVNEVWNEITHYLPPEFWIQACVDADIFVRECRYNNPEDWKVFIASMLQRKKDMKTSACFQVVHHIMRWPLSAIYCKDNIFAVAFDIVNRIEIKDMDTWDLIQSFQLNFRPLFVKFDGDILVAGSKRTGEILLWSIESGRLLKDYSNSEELTTCFDFMTDFHIFVNGFVDTSRLITGIHMYEMSDEQVHKRLIFQCQSPIVRVMLAPHPENPTHGEWTTSFLFCLAMDYVQVFKVVIHFHHISSYPVASRRFYNIPPKVRPATNIIYKPPGGLLFDGENLYIMTPSLPTASRVIWRWNFGSGDRPSRMENADQIISLLGVGKRYLAYETKKREYGRNCESIRVYDKFTEELVATVAMPKRDLLNDDYLCLVDTSWLDGLDGDNDGGVVSMSISKTLRGVNFTVFKPRRE